MGKKDAQEQRPAGGLTAFTQQNWTAIEGKLRRQLLLLLPLLEAAAVSNYT